MDHKGDKLFYKVISMTHIDKMNEALDFIETHITEEVNLALVARKACCSVDLFLRTFSFLAEISISEYIRRRKLTLAAFDLYNGAKVVDVSSKYGYSSPEAFTRAFKGLHGVTPMIARNSNTELKAYPKLSFHLSIYGDDEIEYRIVPKRAYEVCGIVKDIPRNCEKTNPVITQFWEDNINNGVIGKFHRDIGLAYDISLNAALFNYSQSAFSYMICHEAPQCLSAKEYSVLSVPPFTWAVFSTPEHRAQKTTEIVRNMRTKIFTDWFPTSGYIHAGGPEFEMFNNNYGKYVIEIWIPITKYA